MKEIDEAFNNYVKEVKKLDTNGKRKELYDSLMDLGRNIYDLANKEGLNVHLLQNKEVNDLFNENLSEDDFLEGMLVYLEMIKNLIGEYLYQKEV